MFDLIRRIIANPTDQDRNSTPDPDKRIRVAACALLLEAAHADYECTDEELDHVLETIQTRFGLDGQEASEIVALARAERKHAVDLFAFTKMVNESFSREEKIELLENVWRIIHMDGKLDKYEDHYVRKLTGLLRLYHEDMIDTKIRARNGARMAPPSEKSGPSGE